MMLSTCACTETSSAEVGSSQTRNSGCVASARAIEMRWRCPPENWCGNFSASAGARPTDASSSPTRSADALPRVLAGAGAPSPKPCSRSGSATMSLHLPARIQARVRILEDHLHAPAHRAPARALPRGAGVDAVEDDPAARRRVQADEQARDRALAAARFADQRQRLAALDREADVVDRMDELPRLALDHAVEPGRRDVEGLGQAVDLDQRRSLKRAHAAPAAARVQPAGRPGRAAPAGGRAARRRQRSNARGQRGLKAQPGGIAVRRGIAPSICSRRARSSSIAGIEPIRPTRVRMRGRMDDRLDRADLDDPAGVHHGDAVAGLGDHAHVVGDQHDRRAVLLAQALEQRNDLRLDRDVERRRRLVGDDQLRLAGEREGDHDALAHAARELVRVLVEALLGRRNAGLLQQPDRAPARLGGADRQVRLDRLDQLPADRVERIERGQRILEDGADRAAAHLAHLPRRAGCRCAGRRSGSRRRRCARADRAGR